jgi:hypothetical protein
MVRVTGIHSVALDNKWRITVIFDYIGNENKVPDHFRDAHQIGHPIAQPFIIESALSAQSQAVSLTYLANKKHVDECYEYVAYICDSYHFDSHCFSFCILPPTFLVVGSLKISSFCSLSLSVFSTGSLMPASLHR